MIDSLQMFDREGIPEELATTIIQYLRNWMGEQHFPVDPMDFLSAKYGIVDEDLDDFVLSIASDCGRNPPSDTSYWPTPITTVRDLAHFVMSFPEKST